MKSYLIIFTLVLLFSCTSKNNPSPLLFKEISSEKTNITFSNDLEYKDSLNIIDFLYYYNGGGVAIGDINNDGKEDLFFTANQKPNKLYLNLGDFNFKDFTEEAGILDTGFWSTGVSIADINNDGNVDIYVCAVGNYKTLKGRNLLYLNNGDGTFNEVAKTYGLDFTGFSTQASFFDYDRDGDLDMYLLNHSVHTVNSYGKSNKRFDKDPLAGDRLFENKLNEKENRFVDVTEKAGIYSSSLGYGLAIKTADINNDGWTDIYIGNDFHENDYIYINQKDKTFKELGETYMSHTSRFTMGVDIADINNDSHTDIFTLDMMPFSAEVLLKSGGEEEDEISTIKEDFGYGKQYANNQLQLNTQKGYFEEISALTNTFATDWSWSVLLEDFDNNSYKDIFITNGIYKRPNDLDYINFMSSASFSEYSREKRMELEQKIIEIMPTLKISNILYLNNGALEFEKQNKNIGLTPSYSNGAATADLDNDGDLDIVVNNINQKATILETKLSNPTNYLTLKLKGNKKYPSIFNAKVYLYNGDKKLYKELAPAKGFQSSSSHLLHFGLGDFSTIDSLEIVWADGKLQTVKNVAINQTLLVERPNATLPNYTYVKSPSKKIKDFPLTHKENYYLDYKSEILIPEMLSKEGPAVVSSDFNKDGLTDVFVGGGRFQEPSLFFQKEDGSFTKQQEKLFANENVYEDVDAVAFDFENDGDLDIYVARGGNDNYENQETFEDRIYINDGNGIFSIHKHPLPQINSGSVAAGDFDKDGFIDIFVGGRSVPGAYGLSPNSYLLKNNGKLGFSIFFEQRLGMITDSEWVDVNNDSFLDLVAVGDWMPVSIYLNLDGKNFENATAEYNLENTEGLWNVVKVLDINEDGKKDFLVGNAGLNTKWKASAKKPIQLYLDDIDDNERLDPIIFYPYQDTLVPFATKNQLDKQVPSLKKRFRSYTGFSKVRTFEQLTGKNTTDILVQKSIAELQSMLFVQGEKGFEKIPLPTEAQKSTIQDFYVADTKDSKKIVYVGNNLGHLNFLGNATANAGGILTYTKDTMMHKELLPLPPFKSYRKILSIDKKQLLIATNNDQFYLLDK